MQESGSNGPDILGCTATLQLPILREKRPDQASGWMPRASARVLMYLI
jgi:hypothetical protein